MTVSHASDGTKTCAFSATCGIDVTLSGTFYGDVTASGSGTFNTIARASSISSVTSSVSVNGTNAVTVNITRASSSFTHTVVFSFGSYSKTTTDVGTSTSYAIPTSWLNAIPSATSGTAKVTVTTYSGSTKIGSAVAKNFTLTVPSTVVPTISSVAVADTTTNQSTFGNMVQNKSKAKLTITAAGALGSTIAAYKTVFESKTYTGATPTTATITKSGTASASITVTDSRGRTATTTKTWTVVAYSAPKIVSFQGFRCLSNGTANYEGTYLNAAVNFSISSVGNKNAKSYSIEYKPTSGSTWTTLTSGSVYALNQNVISASSFMSVDRSYDIRLSVTDSFTTVRSTFEIPTAFTLLDINASGRGIAFGKVSELTEGVEFALPTVFSHAETPSSMTYLQDGQNLNDIMEPGFYSIPTTTVSGSLLNKPWTTTATGSMIVMTEGNGGQRTQIVHKGSKTDGLIWQRQYYTNAWSDWFLVGGSTSWVNLTLDDGFVLYNGTAVNQPQYRVNGNLVTVRGSVSPKTAYTSGTTKVTIASGIPAEYRPENALSFVCQGSGMNRWTLGVETNGTITVSRYGITEGVSVATTAWLVFHCTYSL